MRASCSTSESGWPARNEKRAGDPEFPPNCLPVEDLTAVGYPRPAPFFTASDLVFFI
jgi:hypothetical protein